MPGGVCVCYGRRQPHRHILNGSFVSGSGYFDRSGGGHVLGGGKDFCTALLDWADWVNRTEAVENLGNSVTEYRLYLITVI